MDHLYRLMVRRVRLLDVLIGSIYSKCTGKVREHKGYHYDYTSTPTSAYYYYTCYTCHTEWGSPTYPYTCSQCGRDVGKYSPYSLRDYSSCPGDIKTGDCSVCGGDGLVDKPINCTHSRSSSHSYCGHGRVGLHDN